VGTLVAYADEVRRVQNATGATAEDSSKLIQILDDQKISYEQLEKAIAKNGKAYDFSIEGIARMSDEYLSLGNAQKQAEFMQKRFGKAWIDFVPIMQQGSSAIRDNADAIDDSLILTQKAVDQAREYEIALDNWNDSIEAVKVGLGLGLLPALTKLINFSNQYNTAQKEQISGWERLFPPIAIVHGAIVAFNSVEEESTQAVDENAQAVEDESAALAENAARIKEVSAAHQSMLGLIGSIANETNNYSEKQSELTAKMQENRAEAALLYPWQSEQLSELNQKYVDMQATYEVNAAAHNAAMGKIQYDLLVTKLSVDGITDAEFAMIQQAGLMFGVFDQGSVNAAQNMNAVAAAVEAGKLRVEDMKAALEMLANGRYTVDVVLNTLTNIAQGQQAMNGGGSMMAAPSYQAGRGYAAGGISTGPAGGHMELLHGTEAVIPLQNGSIPVSMSGGGGVNINLTIASPMTIMNEQTVRSTLMPFIVQGVREAKARGAL
jgi:hypothetical protein